jgi:hypothetical protein
MVVADVLQSVGYALDDVVLLNDGHEYPRIQGYFALEAVPTSSLASSS